MDFMRLRHKGCNRPPPSLVWCRQRFPPRSPVQDVSVYIANVSCLYSFRVSCFFLFSFFLSPFFSLSLSLSLLIFSLYLSPSLSTSGYEEIPQGHNRGYGEIEFVRGDSLIIFTSWRARSIYSQDIVNVLIEEGTENGDYRRIYMRGVF